MSARRHILLIMLILLCGRGMLHAEKTLYAKLINSSIGLSNNAINDIYQDSKGYLWLATLDGLNRYDGYEYLVFRPEIYNPSSINSGIVYSISEDVHGNIWVGTNKGLSKYDVNSGDFVNIDFKHLSTANIDNQILDLTFSNDTTLWCLQPNSIVCYNTEANTYVEYPNSESKENNIVNHKLHYDYTHDIFLIATNNGIYYLNLLAAEIEACCLMGQEIFDIYDDDCGHLWFVTDRGLVQCLWNNESKLPSGCKLVFGNNSIIGISQNADKQLILATSDNILLYDRQKKELVSDQYIRPTNGGEFPEIHSIFVDRSQNIWIGTSGGICQAQLRKLPFSFYNTKSDELPLQWNMISSILASKQELYLGSWGGGLEVIDLKSGKKRIYSDKNLTYQEGGVNVIFKDSKNRIWIGGESMYLFNKDLDSFTSVGDALSIPGMENMIGSRIFDIVELADEKLIIGRESGLDIIDQRKKTYTNITEIVIDSHTVFLTDVINVQKDGSYLWLGTYSGIVHYSLEDDEHEFYPSDGSNGLEDRALTLKMDSDEHLWVGTPSGLFMLDEKTRKFLGYSVQAGLANDFIYSIEEDQNKRLWLGTNKGIISLDINSGEVKNYGVQHGLSCMEFNLNSSFCRDDGLFMFGCINGVNFFYPDSLEAAATSPKTEICGIRYINSEGSTYEALVPSEIHIKDNQTIQIFFSLLNFEDPLYTDYYYRVSGLNKEGAWSNIGNENSIILSGLSHGKYRIEVFGASCGGDWSLLPAELKLNVHAPFFRQRIFMGLMFLPIVLLVFFLFEYRTKTLRKSNKALREKEVIAREVLRQKNLLSRRNKGIEDSLKYAQRIQYAMFTSETEIRKMFPSSFILQKPKDIVSGDFYWAKKIGSKVFIAAADCTGHGVPGAFMSLIGLEFFRQIIGVQGVSQPSLILDEINKNFDLIFDNEDDLNMRDGMDLALCVIDTNTNVLEYSGAFSPLYIIREGEIVEIKADKIMLGPDLGFGRRAFKNNVFELKEHDVIYMFSDGYADQFGGPEGKKFKFRRFRHLLLSIYDKPMELQRKILENSFHDWQGSNEQVDDILVMGFTPVLSI